MENPNNSSVSMSNIFNENRDRMNRIIGANNRINSNNYKAKGLTLTNQITSDKSLVTATETQDRSKEGLEGGAFAGSLNHIQDVYDKGAKLVKKGQGAVKQISQVGDKISSISNPIGAVSKTASTESKVGGILGDTSTAGKVDKVLKGVNILTGGIDAYEDIKAGGIAGKTGLDKTSNVAGMVSGGAEAGEVAGAGLSAGLELAGLGFDTSVIGAPVGAVLGVAGLIAGGVSLLTGIAGDIKDEHEEKSQVNVDVDKRNANAQQESKSQPQQQQAFQSLSQQGQVASNILH